MTHATHTTSRSEATRMLLASGLVVGPLFVVVAGVQVLTREGFVALLMWTWISTLAARLMTADTARGGVS